MATWFFPAAQGKFVAGLIAQPTQAERDAVPGQIQAVYTKVWIAAATVALLITLASSFIWRLMRTYIPDPDRVEAVVLH